MDEKDKIRHANEVWAMANEAFKQADEAFKQADKMFEQADQILRGKAMEPKSRIDVRRQEDRDEISFIAETRAARWRFVRMFLKSAWTMAWASRVKLRITSRSQS